MKFEVIGRLPDEVATWTGTAAALAEQCNELMPAVGLGEEAGSANERLIRHYVQIGVLTPPEREGREAIFGARQVGEFLTARRLLADGWPLAKIGELLKGLVMVEEGDAAQGQKTAGPTKAEKVLSRLRSRGESSRGDVLRSASADFVSDSGLGKMDFSQPGRSDTRQESLRLAAQISQRRGELREELIALGNATGEPERRRFVRISLTPWCHLDIEADRLDQLTETDLETLGNVLANALREERLRKGDSK